MVSETISEPAIAETVFDGLRHFRPPLFEPPRWKILAIVEREKRTGRYRAFRRQTPLNLRWS